MQTTLSNLLKPTAITLSVHHSILMSLWNHCLWSSTLKLKLGCNVLEVIYSLLKESHHLSILNVVVYIVLCLTVIIFVWPDVTKTNKHENWIYFFVSQQTEENRLYTKGYLIFMWVFLFLPSLLTLTHNCISQQSCTENNIHHNRFFKSILFQKTCLKSKITQINKSSDYSIAMLFPVDIAQH